MDEIRFFTTEEEFADWLGNNHATASDLWVGYYKKRTGRPSITWSQSVDAALCYGWIDGVRKSIDAQSYKIRFTPRNPKSVWSAVNVNKVKKLTKLGKMKPAGLALYNIRKDEEGYTSDSRRMSLDPKFEEELKASETAWAFFSGLAPSYKRDSIWWVMSAKREETRLKRFAILLASSKDGKKIPMLRKN